MKRRISSMSPSNPYRQRKLETAANRLLAKAGFFKPVVAEAEFPNDPAMQAAYDNLVGNRLSADAVSPHGHLRATWTGKIGPTDILTR